MALASEQELKDALSGNDKNRASAILEELRQHDHLNSFLKGLVVYPRYFSPIDIGHILDLGIDPNHIIAGGTLLASGAYHGKFDLDDKTKQRRIFITLLKRGADPNKSFTPAESGAGNDSLSIFSMLILPTLGRDEIQEPSLTQLMEELCKAGLKVKATGAGELPLLQQAVLNLSPTVLLRTNPLRPFKPQEASDILSMLTALGADLSLPFPKTNAHIEQHYLASDYKIKRLNPENKSPIALLEAYRDTVVNAMDQPENLQKTLTEGSEYAWGSQLRGYETNLERLEQLKQFYDKVIQTLKQRYTASGPSTSPAATMGNSR